MKINGTFESLTNLQRIKHSVQWKGSLFFNAHDVTMTSTNNFSASKIKEVQPL